MNLIFLLRSCKLFSDLNQQELEAVQAISWRKDYKKGEIIFGEGDKSFGFFLCVAGAVKIARITPDGRERVFHVCEPGDTFAEAAMFMEIYPATAEALTPATVICVEKNGFKHLIARDPRLSFKIIGTLVHWLRQMRDALTDLTTKEVPARFASYVLSLPFESGRVLTVRVSKTTLAQMLGTTKETLSRVLKRLSAQRVLTFRGSQIRILDRPTLEKIAAGTKKI